MMSNTNSMQRSSERETCAHSRLRTRIQDSENIRKHHQATKEIVDRVHGDCRLHSLDMAILTQTERGYGSIPEALQTVCVLFGEKSMTPSPSIIQNTWMFSKDKNERAHKVGANNAHDEYMGNSLGLDMTRQNTHCCCVSVTASPDTVQEVRALLCDKHDAAEKENIEVFDSKAINKVFVITMNMVNIRKYIKRDVH